MVGTGVYGSALQYLVYFLILAVILILAKDRYFLYIYIYLISQCCILNALVTLGTSYYLG